MNGNQIQQIWALHMLCIDLLDVLYIWAYLFTIQTLMLLITLILIQDILKYFKCPSSSHNICVMNSLSDLPKYPA